MGSAVQTIRHTSKSAVGETSLSWQSPTSSLGRIGGTSFDQDGFKAAFAARSQARKLISPGANQQG